MRAVACPDKFRGTLSASDAATAIAAGLTRAGFDEVRTLPLADGGEGTMDALLAAL
ncbi:MAG TPA: glycerate kinase, partial [Acidimicrobiia bacterium]|nr:glycerate kinase [Acidimicrobiia bacterium]